MQKQHPLRNEIEPDPEEYFSYLDSWNPVQWKIPLFLRYQRHPGPVLQILQEFFISIRREEMPVSAYPLHLL